MHPVLLGRGDSPPIGRVVCPHGLDICPACRGGLEAQRDAVAQEPAVADVLDAEGTVLEAAEMLLAAYDANPAAFPPEAVRVAEAAATLIRLYARAQR